MALGENEHTLGDPSYLTLENGKFKGTIVIRTSSCVSNEEIHIHCIDERETVAEALKDAENLAKDYQS